MSREVCAFTYYGEAIAKGRPRATVRGGFASVYTPARTRSFEGKVNAVATVAMQAIGTAPTPDAVEVVIAFDRQMPKSWSKAKRLLMRGEPVVSGSDLDNQAKAVLDALNDVVWEDDVQVSDLSVSRRWADEHAFRITVSLAEGPGFLAEAA